MRFKEFVTGLGAKTTNTVFNYGTRNYGTNIYNNQERTPHWEMTESMNIIETRPQINAGLKQIVRFIMGQEISVESEDNHSKEFMLKWIKDRPSLRNTIFNLAYLGISLGNSYLEPIFKVVNDKKIFYDIKCVPDPTRIYINLSDTMKDEEDYWIYQMPAEVKIMNDIDKPLKYYRINYMRGNNLFRYSVYGIPFSKNHFDHFKMGWSRDGLYGRGYIASTIDDNNALSEILKNVAVIARYRALNTKLIMPASDEIELIEDDIEDIERKLLTKRDEDHLVLNKNLKIESLSNTNEYDTMSNEIDFLRRDINSGLVPNFITPFDNDVNRATAGESKIPFVLELESIKKDIIDFLNTTIIDRLIKSGFNISRDTTFYFKPISMESYESRVSISQNLYSSGLITFNEARDMVDLQIVNNGDKFNWEMQKQDNTMFDDLAGTTISSNFKEKHISIDLDSKKLKRICYNCKFFKPVKRMCDKFKWPVELQDSCNGFSKKEEVKDKNLML